MFRSGKPKAANFFKGGGPKSRATRHGPPGSQQPAPSYPPSPETGPHASSASSSSELATARASSDKLVPAEAPRDGLSQPSQLPPLPSLPLPRLLTGGQFKWELIFQVPPHKCHVSGKKGTQNGLLDRNKDNLPASCASTFILGLPHLQFRGGGGVMRQTPVRGLSLLPFRKLAQPEVSLQKK